MNYFTTDVELTSIANAIRNKNGTSELLTFPNDFISAINNIPRTLPVAYKQVEYIESTGTQYIDTGVAISSSMTIDTDFVVTNVQDANQFIYGIAKTTSPTKRLALFCHNASAEKYARFVYSNSEGNAQTDPFNIVESQTNFTRVSVLDSSVTFTVNNISQSSSITTDIGNLTFALFARHATTGYDYLASMKLYKSIFTINNQVVRDFVPCYRISDNEIGLYDIANAQFYTNAGTGTFLKGPDI